MNDTLPDGDRAPGLPRYRCFGCSPDNPIGLALTSRMAEDALTSPFTLTPLHESYPGIAHGGLVSAILDEVMGNLVALRWNRLALTSTLRVRYLLPVRVDRPYRAVARLLNRDGPIFEVESEVLAEDGTIVVMARGTYRAMEAADTLQALTLSPDELAALAPYLGGASPSGGPHGQ